MPIVIANWYSDTKRPRRWAGASSAAYSGAATDATPTPKPTISRPTTSTAGPGGERLDGGADREQRRRRRGSSAPARAVGEDAGHERTGQRAERDPAGDDLAERRADGELLLDAVQRAGDDALVVAEQQPGQHDDDADADQPAGAARRGAAGAAVSDAAATASNVPVMGPLPSLGQGSYCARLFAESTVIAL